MLNKVMERDQISWACSAQDAKLLPKKNHRTGFKQKLEEQSKMFIWPEKKKPSTKSVT